LNDHAYFKTARFNSAEVKPHFINDRCFGEDLAGWLASQFAKRDVICMPLIQEDWGWSLPVLLDDRTFYVNVGIMDEPSDPPTWLAFVEPRRRLRGWLSRRTFATRQQALCDHLAAILSSDPTITEIEWSNH